MEDKLNFMTTEGVEPILSFDQMGIKNKRELGENDEDTNHFFFFALPNPPNSPSAQNLEPRRERK